MFLYSHFDSQTVSLNIPTPQEVQRLISEKVPLESDPKKCLKLYHPSSSKGNNPISKSGWFFEIKNLLYIKNL